FATLLFIFIRKNGFPLFSSFISEINCSIVRFLGSFSFLSLTESIVALISFSPMTKMYLSIQFRHRECFFPHSHFYHLHQLEYYFLLIYLLDCYNNPKTRVLQVLF